MASEYSECIVFIEHFAMLTDTHCRNAKPKPKLYRLTDHRGLCLEVKPSGVKAWRYRFTLEGKASMFALGEYPAVSLAEARDRCEAARQLVKQGINPAQQRQIDRIKQASDAEITFEKVAREWLQTKDWEDATKNRRLDMLERVVFGEIGQMPIRAITPVQSRRAATQPTSPSGPHSTSATWNQ